MPNPNIPLHFSTRITSHFFLLQNTYVTELDANEKERLESLDRYYAATHFWYPYVYTIHKSKHPIF
jgi:hypothetical protein